MKRNIIDTIRCKRLYFDGGTGTVLQSMGLEGGKAPEIWNIECPEKIENLHRSYIEAGADIIKTNTFGVNRKKYTNYEQLIRAAIRIAKRAASENTYVAFDVGPTGSLLKPLGDMEFEDAVSIFKDSVAVAATEGVDLVLIETMNDSYETKAAILGAKEAAPQLPIFVTNVYDEKGKLMTGASPEAMICMLEGLGVSAIGMNCSLGPDKMAELLPRFIKSASVPIIVNPNAGLPSVIDGKTVFDCKADDYARIMKKMAECGAHILGGCCGTTPEYIKLLCEATNDIPYASIVEKNFTRVSSYTHSVDFGALPVLIGERINPTGKPKLKEALRNANIDYLVTEALGEQETGAEILDVNVGLPEIDEKETMLRAIDAISAVCDLPLQIDSSSPETLEAAMRIYNGKALVNSVNGKDEIMKAVFPAVKKYGGTVIALTLDESGIPDTAEGRVEIAEKIISRAAEYGIEKKDIIVDPLALSVSSDSSSARVTLKAIELLSEKGIKTSLGVSNISFGLPSRDKINSAFFVMAMQKGLSAAIMNPYSAAMTDAYRAYKVLSGLDTGCAEYIEANAEEKKTQSAVSEKSKINLYYAVRHGLSDRAVSLAAEELISKEPLEIINSLLIPALNEIGKEFENGRAYLPELLKSAEAASSAFSEIKKKIPEGKSDGRGVILATVKGDIHDIGKNILKVLLESYGFSVIDLGRDVAPEKIVSAAIDNNIKLVGLSALMTTTVGAMKETICLMREKAPEVKIMVGGAVLTPEYAEMIGADYYGQDAMDAVRIAEEVFR